MGLNVRKHSGRRKKDFIATRVVLCVDLTEASINCSQPLAPPLLTGWRSNGVSKLCLQVSVNHWLVWAGRGGGLWRVPSSLSVITTKAGP